MQLRLMDFLEGRASGNGRNPIQILVTTHSPNLASTVDLESVVIMHEGRAYSLATTRLEASDYRFLQRFLDVTKANLFFAKGVMIVEGHAENILLPTFAMLVSFNARMIKFCPSR
jgi:putative ATP-dependent endonuclease of OLD family